MFLCRDYDKDKKLDRAWYNSSNILYSECDDNENALKTLRVTFANGRTYKYNEVDVNDYLMFLNGGLDGSSGKAFNKYIKAKYPAERLADMNTNNIQFEKNQFLAKLNQEKPDSFTSQASV